MQSQILGTAVIVGSDGLVSAGVTQILGAAGFSVSVHSGTIDALIAETTESPQFILVDDESSDDPLAACARLQRVYAPARVALLAGRCDAAEVARAYRLGVDGYLIKGSSRAALAGAVNMIMVGERYIPSAAYEAMPRFQQIMAATSFQDDCTAMGLSDREIETLKRLARGDPNKAIARELAITEETVKVHIKAILRKLHVLNRTQAAAWAIHRGAGASVAAMASAHATVAARRTAGRPTALAAVH